MNRRDLFKLAGKVGLVALAQQVPWSVIERLGLTDDYLAEAAALPQNYAVNAGTVLGDTNGGLAGLLSYTGGGTGAQWDIYEDTTNLYPIGTATKMLAANCTNAGSSQPQVQFNWTVNVAPNIFSNLSFPVYVDIEGAAAPNTPVSVSILLAENSGFTAFWTYNDSNVYNRHWNNFRVGRQHAIGTGSPNPANACVRLRVLVVYPAGATGAVIVGPVQMSRRNKPVVTLSFDDGWDSVQTIYEYLQPRGIPISAAVNGYTIGNASRLTVAQLQTMQANGCSIHDHTWDHIDGATQPTDALYESTRRNREWMQVYGLTSGIDSFVYPFGSVQQADGWASAASSIYRYAWSAEGSFYGQDTLDGLPTPMRVERVGFNDASSTLDRLHRAIAAGKSIHFFGHTETLASLQSALDTIVRYHHAGVIEVRNLADFIRGLTNPRRRR